MNDAAVAVELEYKKNNTSTSIDSETHTATRMNTVLSVLSPSTPAVLVLGISRLEHSSYSIDYHRFWQKIVTEPPVQLCCAGVCSLYCSISQKGPTVPV